MSHDYSDRCTCNLCIDARNEMRNVQAMRDSVAYGRSQNSIIKWMNSDKWTDAPRSTKTRGEAIIKILKTGHAKIEKFVVNGEVSGVIPWR